MFKTCLHIGFHKTASTYLQRYVFSKHPQINYLGKFEKELKAINSGKNYLIEFDQLLFKLFNYKLENIDQNSTFDKIIEPKENKLNVVSEERISSYFYYKDQNAKYIFKKLKYIFQSNNDLKIVLLIRNQKDLLISRYSENFKLFYDINPNWKIFKNFAKNITEEKLSSLEKHILDNYKYYDFIINLQNFLPKDKIGIFIYEDLRNNPKLFFKNFFNFLEIDNIELENKKEYYSQVYKGFYENKKNFFSSHRVNETNLLRFKKYINIPKNLLKTIKYLIIIFVSYPNYIYQIFTNPISKSKTYKKNVEKYYKKDNKKLSQLLGRNLEDLGY